MLKRSLPFCLAAMLGLSVVTASPAAAKTIFLGVTGATSPDQVNDSNTRVIQTWDDPNEMLYSIQNRVPACATRICSNASMDDIRAIAVTDPLGGIGALAFYFSGGDAKSALNTPGNTEVLKNYVDVNYQPGDRVIVVGFSAGGGDVQDVLVKLNALAIPVALSGQIDSAEIGDDSSIPGNTRLAKGFYQKESSRNFRGESRLVSLDANKTTVTNQQIVKPVGPYTKNDGTAPHRNMDNDERVWGAIIDAANAPALPPVEVEALAVPALPANSDPQYLLSMLEYSTSGDEQRQIRNTLVSHTDKAGVYDAVMARYNRATAGNMRLQYQSILAKLDVATYLDKVTGEAKTTKDEGLFVSLCYGIGGSASRQALPALLDVLANPLVGKSPQAAVAVNVNAKRVLNVENRSWLQNQLKADTLTPVQKKFASSLVK